MFRGHKRDGVFAVEKKITLGNAAKAVRRQ